MEHLCSLKNTLMCVSSNIDIDIDIECEYGGNKILYFQQKVGSNLTWKSFHE